MTDIFDELLENSTFKAPDREAVAYIKSLPVYEDYSHSLETLPNSGAYRLPIEPCGKQWLFLDNFFSEHLDSKNLYRYSSDFFGKLPGIKAVNFEEIAIIPDPKREGSIGARSSMLVYSAGHEAEFSVRKHLVFEDSVAGAISALVISTTINKYISFWHALYGCDHDFIAYEENVPGKQKRKTAKGSQNSAFPSAFSEINPIPWGFRVEILEAGHYLVRGLAQSPTSGLIDLSTELKNGSIVRAFGIVVQEDLNCVLY